MFFKVKIVIRGESGVGKSKLLSRLKGQNFDETYVPSTQIQVKFLFYFYLLKITKGLIVYLILCFLNYKLINLLIVYCYFNFFINYYYLFFVTHVFIVISCFN